MSFRARRATPPDTVNPTLPATGQSPSPLTNPPIESDSAAAQVAGIETVNSSTDGPPDDQASTEQTAPVRLPTTTVTRLYTDYSEELRCFLLGVLGNPDAAGEVLQITFARLVERGHTAREETIKGWLFRVAYNEAMTLRRRAAVRNKAAALLREQGEPAVAAPEESLLSREATDAVQRAMEELPEELRRIVRLRIYNERTLAAIAAELNLPLGTVYARLQLALKKLKSELKHSQ